MVCGKILWLPRPRPFCEIQRRSDNHHAHIRPYTDRDHVFRDVLPEPHTRIETLRDDVS